MLKFITVMLFKKKLLGVLEKMKDIKLQVNVNINIS